MAAEAPSSKLKFICCRGRGREDCDKIVQNPLFRNGIPVTKQRCETCYVRDQVLCKFKLRGESCTRPADLMYGGVCNLHDKRCRTCGCEKESIAQPASVYKTFYERYCPNCDGSPKDCKVCPQEVPHKTSRDMCRPCFAQNRRVPAWVQCCTPGCEHTAEYHGLRSFCRKCKKKEKKRRQKQKKLA